MTTTRKPALDATPAYEHAHLVAQDLIERIRELLMDLPSPGIEERRIDWADVGTVIQVTQQLTEVIAFLECRTP